MWTTTYSQILTLDNLMLLGRPLANRCCLCCNEESMDYLLIFCPLAHSLWVHMLQLFGIHWVMLGSVANLLFCWQQWLGKHNCDIWNLVPGFLIWIIWTERNQCSFKDTEKSLTQLIDLCQRTLLDLSWCCSFLDCSSLIKVLLSLSIASWFLCFFAFRFVLLCSLLWTPCILFPFSFFNNITLLPIKKKVLITIGLYQGLALSPYL